MIMRTVGQWSAILVCGLAAAALAISQAFVIHDHVAMVHGGVATPPPWPAIAQWSMAVGFELAILSVTLAVAMVGWHRGLIVAEAFLIGVSVLAGALVTYPGPVAPFVETASMAMVPLQYVAVVLAAHALHRHYAATPATDQTTAVTTPAARVATVATVATDQTTVATRAAATVPRPRPPASRPSPTTADPRVTMAIAAGVPRTTARRWAATGDARLDQYGPQSRVA